MDLNLNNRTVLVTGGASGIGEAIVRKLAREGAVPVILDRDREAAESVVAELLTEGHQIEFVAADLGSASACREAAETAIRKTGTLYGLVNNAGDNDGVGLEQGSPKAFLGSLEKNLHHYYFMAQACLEELKREGGAIVNISSKTALTGQGGTSGYVAAKAAQLGLTREWAVELLPWQIRVNAIIPAEVLTPHYRKWLERSPDPEARRREIESNIPLGNRLTTPDEIADTTLFLLSDRASHITGQFLHVDGGYLHLDRSIPPSKKH